MKNFLLIALLLLVVIVVGAYYKLRSSGIELRFSESEIETRLISHMPVQKNYLAVFDLELDNPKVRFSESVERILIVLDLGLNINIGVNPRELTGQIAFSSQFNYDPNQAALYLSQPYVEQINLPGVPQNYLDNAESILSAAMTVYFENNPIYTIEGDSFKHVSSRLIIKDVSIDQDNLKISLGL